jgi:cellulase
MSNNHIGGKLDFAIPKNIAPGDYLLRAEAIALHSASASGGAQHYMTCYQLTVTGSGTLEPKGVTFPEAYTKDGQGLGFSIHADLDSYPAPGPALIEGGTDVAPSLLTFGKLSGAPAATATGAASMAPVSTAASVAASSTAAVEAASSVVVVSSAAVEASSTAVVSSAAVEATSAAPVATSAAVVTPSASVAAPVEAISTPAAAITSVVPYPVSNGTSSVVLPGTASPIRGVSSAAVSVVPSTLVTAVRPTPTAVASGPIKEYYQCGGQGFKGTTECADGLVCKEWNSWYSQCVEPGVSQLVSSKGPMPTTVVAAQPSSYFPSASAARPTATYVAVEPSAEAPKPTSVAAEVADPTSVAPAAEPSSTAAPAAGEKTYTLETFIAFLEQEAGSASAAKIRRMIEALQ